MIARIGRFTFPVSCVLALTASLVSSTEALPTPDLIGAYRFEDGLSNSITGPNALPSLTLEPFVGEGGTRDFVSGALVWSDTPASDKGLKLRLDRGSDASILSSYSIRMSFQLGELSGYQKLLDMSGLTSETGIYSQNLSLAIYDSGSVTTLPFLEENKLITFILTYDSGSTHLYFDGGLALSGSMLNSEIGQYLWFFTDDEASGLLEYSRDGSLSSLYIWDGALSEGDAIEMLSVIPEPSAFLMMASGVGLLGMLRRRPLRTARG